MYNKNSRSAFTLIELLVVIAIIAILAAILFPVFAQAKAAAKDSAALSNVKQLATGHLMYSADYDDTFALMTTRPFFVDSSNTGTTGAWQALLRPYTKNMQIAYHPKTNAPSSSDPQKWIKEWQYWGVVARASALANNNAGTEYIQDGTLTGGVQAFLDGPFGAAVDAVNPTGTWANTTNSPSLSQTAIENISEVIMVAEGTNWDFGWGINGNGSGRLGVFCGAVWVASQSVYPAQSIQGSPSARKSPQGGADGVSSCLYPKGLTTYAATDGSAKAVDYRGKIWERYTTSSGRVVLKRMWAGSL